MPAANVIALPDHIDFITKTLGCLPVANIENLKPEKFGKADLVVEENTPEGKIVKEYDKLHLVPFGEYIPLKNTFKFLETIVPIGDFTAGKDYTLFKLLL
jgi:hypothetical protein